MPASSTIAYLRFLVALISDSNSSSEEIPFGITVSNSCPSNILAPSSEDKVVNITLPLAV